MYWDVLAFLATVLECVAWLKFCNYLAEKHITDKALSRKMNHIGSKRYSLSTDRCYCELIYSADEHYRPSTTF